jgi:large repetitive protein
VADVRITKTNNTNSLVTGTTTSYTITVQNLGPSAADGTVLRDSAVTGLNATAVSCGGAAGGAACPAAAAVTVANLQGTGVTVPTLPAGGSLSFTVTGTINATGQP